MNPKNPHCMSRRSFLLTGGMSAAVLLLDLLPGLDKLTAAHVVTYPRKKIATLLDLKPGKPVYFTYPFEDVRNMAIKLGVEAGGGVGQQRDIVAFNSLCPHMGGPLEGTYKETYQVLGPCPLHLTTFDLSRHGMVVSGHATESLPQVVLEVQNNDIYAVGILGLIYGDSNNLRKG